VPEGGLGDAAQFPDRCGSGDHRRVRLRSPRGSLDSARHHRLRSWTGEPGRCLLRRRVDAASALRPLAAGGSLRRARAGDHALAERPCCERTDCIFSRRDFTTRRSTATYRCGGRGCHDSQSSINPAELGMRMRSPSIDDRPSSARLLRGPPVYPGRNSMTRRHRPAAPVPLALARGSNDESLSSSSARTTSSTNVRRRPVGRDGVRRAAWHSPSLLAP
jgi:hypothetical protein